ncbi:MAG: phosphoglycerate dehydrogenase [Vicinamibacterales bacterium]
MENAPLKIVVSDELPASALEILRAEGWQVDAKSGRPPAELAAALADADALIVRSATKVTKDLLAAAPKLRIIGRAGAGVDNIDMPTTNGRGILVVNAPGANSISVAEHAVGLMLSLARPVPAADQAMKAGKWEKKKFAGFELKGKTLGIAGLGRIGQEVAQRARSFGMRILAHDPFISRELAAGLGVELMTLDELCMASDYMTLHLPSTPDTKHIFNDARFAKVKKGIRLINTARGELIDEAALLRALEAGLVGGAGLDVFEKEPPVEWALAQHPKVVATPHIAASTEEAQEMVGTDTANAVRDFLKLGIVRNAVNFPSVHPEELQRLQPWMRLSENLAAVVSEMGDARVESISLRYYGGLSESRTAEILASSAAAGVLRPVLEGGVSVINARAAARERGIEIIETRSTRQRTYTSMVSLKLHSSDQGDNDRWAEGTVFEGHSPRLVSVRGVAVEAPLTGTLLIICNDDQPGVIGEVGSILGKHGVNIANFALGRNATGAVGVVNVDEDASKPGALTASLEAIRKIGAVKHAWLVRLPHSHA